MGWKNVRDHYRIAHIVKIDDGVLKIGSPMVESLVTVTLDGHAEVHRTFSNSADLRRYADEINADGETFRALMAAPDAFTASIPVYTWSGDRIVDKLCETFGWPNVTHDGELMYENRHFLDRKDAIAHACQNARAIVEAYERNVAEARVDLAQREERLSAAMTDARSLEAEALRCGVDIDEDDD